MIFDELNTLKLDIASKSIETYDDSLIPAFKIWWFALFFAFISKTECFSNIGMLTKIVLQTHIFYLKCIKLTFVWSIGIYGSQCIQKIKKIEKIIDFSFSSAQNSPVKPILRSEKNGAVDG